MSSLPASIKGLYKKTTEKKRRHRFSHYEFMEIFQDVKRQLTPQSVVGSGRISNSSEIIACPRYLQV